MTSKDPPVLPAYPYPCNPDEHSAWCDEALRCGVLAVDVHDALVVRLFADWLFGNRPDLRVAVLKHASGAITRSAGEIGMFGGAAALGSEVGLSDPESERLFADLLRRFWADDPD